METTRAALATTLLLAALLSASCSKEAPKAGSPSGTGGAASNQAVVIYASGDVTAVSGTKKATVEIGDALAEGHTLRTGARSECELQLGDKTTIRIEEKTELLLDDIVLDPGRSSIGLRLVLGVLRSKVRTLSGDERFRVSTQTAAVSVRGTEFVVTASAGGDTLVTVQQGEVAILPASIDMDALAARLTTDDRDVAAAFAELWKPEWIARDGQEIQVTRTAFARAEESRAQVERAIEAISGKGKPTAAEKEQFRAAIRDAAADIRASMVPRTSKPAPAPVSTPLPPVDNATNPIPIKILNSSFERPSATFGDLVATDDWVCGGTWYGRWTATPGAAKDGSCAAWASYARGGSENGFSQELDSRYVVGQYILSVWIVGDARGLVSRAVLGYDAGNDEYRIIGSSSVEAPYGHDAGTTWGSGWIRQTLAIDIGDGDPAVGKPMWLRFTNMTAPAPKPQSDSGPYGDSISWDLVTLTRYPYAEHGE